MIRMSEAVLPGHPDKFCDLVAEAIVAECYRADPSAYCQVEMSVWRHKAWLTGCIVTRKPLDCTLASVVKRVGREVGYVKGNSVVASRYRVRDSVEKRIGDPREWTEHVNDQAICIGWAGYDEKVDYLPIEHFLVLKLKDALWASCRGGRLRGYGPDGKVLVRVRENDGEWHLEHVLVSLQHPAAVDFLVFTALVVQELRQAYEGLRRADRRWAARWEDVEVMVNPGGPFINGGSDADNGQTGRKLVMDYYGPRVPIGGGALAGKGHSHIDRVGARTAREAALRPVKTGAQECLVTLAYAPGVDGPVEVRYEMTGRGKCNQWPHVVPRRDGVLDPLMIPP